MKRKLSNLWISLQAIAALSVIGAVKLWAPVCGKMLELANGNTTHMKCFYTGQAAVAVSVVLLTAAVLALWAKTGHKRLMVISALCAVILFLLFTTLIGVCASETMACQVTKHWGIGAAIAAFAASLIELISGKEGQIPG